MPAWEGLCLDLKELLYALYENGCVASLIGNDNAAPA